MNLNNSFTALFCRQLFRSAAGRAHFLAQVADAEDNGEAQIFDQALAKVDDPKLAKMIEKHRADEIRHAALFRAAVERTGVDPGPVPDQLKMLNRIDAELGGFFSRPIKDRRGVMEAYLVLQVLEERAVAQFPLFEKALRPQDPETADVFVEVAQDEVRHLGYCTAISTRYAPDEATLKETLARFRLIEARAFRDNSQANLRYLLEHRLMGGALLRGAWGAVGTVADWVGDGALPMTQFATA